MLAEMKDGENIGDDALGSNNNLQRRPRTNSVADNHHLGGGDLDVGSGCDCGISGIFCCFVILILIAVLAPIGGFLCESVYMINRAKKTKNKALLAGWSVLTTVMSAPIAYGAYKATPPSLAPVFDMYYANRGSNYTNTDCFNQFDPNNCYRISYFPYIMAAISGGMAGLIIFNLPVCVQAIRKWKRQNTRGNIEMKEQRRCINSNVDMIAISDEKKSTSSTFSTSPTHREHSFRRSDSLTSLTFNQYTSPNNFDDKYENKEEQKRTNRVTHHLITFAPNGQVIELPINDSRTNSKDNNDIYINVYRR